MAHRPAFRDKALSSSGQLAITPAVAGPSSANPMLPGRERSTLLITPEKRQPTKFSASYLSSLLTEAERAHVLAALQRVFGDAVTFAPSTVADDKAGTDFFLRLASRPEHPLRVDLKVRSKKYGDLCIELSRDTPNGEALGWALDESKNSDLIVWYFRARGWVFAYDALQFRQTCRENLEEWKQRFYCSKTESSSQNGEARWETRFVVVPPSEFLRYYLRTRPNVPPVLPPTASEKLHQTLFAPVRPQRAKG